MDKTELLLEMLEHRDQYTREQWQEILNDEECRELYQLMALTRSAVVDLDTTSPITDQELDQTWQQLTTRQSSLTQRLGKVAAMVAVLLLLSGLAWAAYTSWRPMPDNPGRGKQPEAMARDKEPDSMSTAQQGHHHYEDTPLSQILDEIASHYGLQLISENAATRSLYLAFVWDESEEIGEIVKRLNRFERIDATLVDDQLTITLNY